MRQLTIRGFDLELERKVRDVAQQEGISMNKAALRLLRRGASLWDDGEARPIGRRLDKYAGTMSDSEAEELLSSMADIRSC